MSRQLPQTAVIIGAGIGGLAVANILAKAGVQVEVYEKNAIPGGRASLLDTEGFRFDTGPSWYLMPDVFRHYYALLGEDITQHLKLTRLDPAYKVFFEDNLPLTIHADEARDVATFEAIEPGAGHALGQYLAKAGYAYDIATKHFLYNNFAFGRWPLSRDIIASVPHMAKALRSPMHQYIKQFVQDQRLQQVLGYPAVFLGTSPYEAPSLYRLMSHMDFRQGVFYPEGGMYTITESLVQIGKSLGVRYYFGQEAIKITARQSKATGVRFADGSFAAADIVISNADLHFTETKLLEVAYQTYPISYWQHRKPGPSALLMYLGVKGHLPELEHHNLLFTSDWKTHFDAIHTQTWPTPASMYICKSSATDTHTAPKGHENIFIMVPVPGIGSQKADTAEYEARYIRQFADMVGKSDLEERIVLRRTFGPEDFAQTFNAWQGSALGMAHTLRQSAVFRPANRSRKLPNLYYVGANTVPGIGLPMCLISAELLYKRLIGDTSSTALDSINM